MIIAWRQVWTVGRSFHYYPKRAVCGLELSYTTITSLFPRFILCYSYLWIFIRVLPLNCAGSLSFTPWCARSVLLAETWRYLEEIQLRMVGIRSSHPYPQHPKVTPPSIHFRFIFDRPSYKVGAIFHLWMILAVNVYLSVIRLTILKFKCILRISPLNAFRYQVVNFRQTWHRDNKLSW